MNPEATYLQHLERIKRTALYVARRAHLNADETDEFVQNVCVRLFENDYAIIRKFEGRSAFTTYLTTVILHLYHQCLVEEKGKWRPSAEAKRLGDTAVVFERLLTRDGFTVSEAVQVLTVRAGAQCTVAELEAIYLRLPLRTGRPVLVSGEVSPDAVSVEPDAEDRLEAEERERSARRATAAIDEAVNGMAAEDRLILQLRFWRSRKVPDIARMLNIDQKKLYKRLDKLLAVLRRALESAGISREDVDKLLGRGDHEIHLGVLPDAGTPPFSPSHPRGEDDGGGEEGTLP